MAKPEMSLKVKSTGNASHRAVAQGLNQASQSMKHFESRQCFKTIFEVRAIVLSLKFAAPQTQRKVGVSNTLSVFSMYLRRSDKNLIHLHPTLSLHKTALCSPCECSQNGRTGFIQGSQHKFLKGPLIFTVMSRSTINPVVFNLHQSGAEVASPQKCSVFCYAPLDKGRKTVHMHKATGVCKEALIEDG